MDSTNQFELVSDTVRKIIDELNLCEYSDFLCYNKKKDCCYEDDISHIRNIKTGDSSYDNFIFQAPGGSGGGAVIVFCKRNGKYQKVQEDNAYVDSILTTSTNGFYDLILWHRAHKVDGEYSLYKWNGKKYVRKKTLTDYKQE